MSPSQLATPWAAGARGYWLPGSILLKLALGEAPEAVPALADVRQGRLVAAQGLDGGVLDRLLRSHASCARITRVHGSAAAAGRPGARHTGFDELEQVLGLARTFRVEVPPGTALAPLLDALGQVATVESAQPNLLSVTPFEVAGTQDEGLDWQPWQQVRAAEALAYEPGSPGVTVAAVDSGVSPGHPELEGRLLAGLDTVQLGNSDLALGVRLLGDRIGVDTHPYDRHVGHGMGCAGITSALGLDMAPGLAGEAQMLPLRALGAAQFPGKPHPVGIGAAADLDMAVKAAVDLGAKVVNMSFGTDDGQLPPNAPRPHADVVAYALERGCVLVAASGNNGGETRYWPAAFPGVIAVGAVGADGRPCGFSTRGPHVALCAPGERIRTLGLSGYQYATGTSFAAPFVTAVAALLVARARRRACPLDGPLVRRLLADSAQPFTGAMPSGCGAGVLDALAALRGVDDWIDRTQPAGSDDEN